MPTQVQVGIWNVGCSVGMGAPAQTLMNFTGTLVHQDRFRLLQDVVASALMLMPPPDKQSPCIRIFLAPEYYFAKSETEKAASYDAKTAVLTDLATLSDKHRELILIPGTVAYCKELVTPTKDRRLKYAKVLSTNPHNPTPVRVAHNTAYVFHGAKQVFKYRKATDAHELEDGERDGGRTVYVPGTGPSVFRLLGQTIGIETCADHQAGWLSRQKQTDLDIHIILSASTTFKREFACVRENGIVCHADSSNEPAVYQKVRGVMVPGATVGISDINPLLNPQLAPTTEARRRDYVRAVEDSLKKLPEKGPSGDPLRGPAVQKKEQAYLNARGGKLGVFQVVI